MSPVRIQRSRKKGWRMPEGAVYVGRGSPWGNKYRLGRNPWYGEKITIRDVETVVELFRNYAQPLATWKPGWLAPLKGHDLVCWCRLDQPCHADVLLELANA